VKSIIANLYETGRLDDAGLDNAVARGWITQAEAEEIRAGAQASGEQP